MAGFGLINYNARLYDPYSQRFMNPDPDVQDPSNAQNLNRYSYCLNNPLRYTDPSGCEPTYDGNPVPPGDNWWDKLKALAADVVHAVVGAITDSHWQDDAPHGHYMANEHDEGSGGSPSGGCGGSTIPDYGGGPKTSSQNSTTANNPYSNTNVNSGGNSSGGGDGGLIGLTGDGDIKRDYRKDWSITDNYDDYKSKDLDIDDNEAGNSFNSCVPACLALISRSFGRTDQDRDQKTWIKRYCAIANIKTKDFNGEDDKIKNAVLDKYRYNCALIKTKPGGSMLDIINQAGVAILNRKNRLVITLSNYKSLDGVHSGRHMMVIKEIRVTKDGNWDMELMNPEGGINYFINRDEYEGGGFISIISEK
jgi:RHS repeat-associated protein